MKKKVLAMILGGIMTMGLASSAMAAEENDHVKVALQMYNFIVGGDWGEVQSLEDVKGLLTRLADAGYDGVEWCNFQLNGDYMDLDEVKNMMDELGLETCGMHFHYGTAESLEEDAARVVERCVALDTDKLIFAYSVPATFGIEADEEGNYTPEQIDEWVENVNVVVDALKTAAEGTDIQILYHNHNREFWKGTSGAYVNDMIEAEGKEVDVYWASKGMDGKVETALEYVKENLDNVYMLHIKDGLDGSVHTGEMCGWGKGTYDIQSIIDVARNSDNIEWVVVENDAPYNFNMLAIDDAEQSAAYIKENIDLTK